jgi:hypothetical protein
VLVSYYSQNNILAGVQPRSGPNRPIKSVHKSSFRPVSLTYICLGHPARHITAQEERHHAHCAAGCLAAQPEPLPPHRPCMPFCVYPPLRLPALVLPSSFSSPFLRTIIATPSSSATWLLNFSHQLLLISLHLFDLAADPLN